MKIAHLVSTYPPYRGGMGNVCFKEAEGLAKLGHKITVFTPPVVEQSSLRGSAFYKNTRSEHQASDVKVVYLKPFFKIGNAAFVPQISSFLKGFDVVHLHWPFIGGAEKILSQRKKLPPLMVQYHMDLIDTGWRGIVFNLYQSIFLKKMMEAADKISVSSFDYLFHSRVNKFYSGFREKFIELPLGIDLEFFFSQSKDQNLKNRLKLNQNDKIVLFVGGLDRAHYFKGLNILLSALAKLEENVKLVVIGEGDLKKKYQSRTDDLKMKERVIFVGSAISSELIKFYNLADVFVLPSISSSEAFGLVSLEAMACAKPIIVSDLPGPRTLVKEGVNGFLVKPADVDDLAEKIKLVLENSKIKEMGEESRKIVEEKYNWSVIIKELENIYKKIINVK